MQRMLLLTFFLLLVYGVFVAETDETVSVMEGDSVTLYTDLTEILNDDTILWVFGPKGMVISQVTRKNDLTSFFVTDDERFIGRLQVDQNTGSLTIRNSRKRHSGQYKLTISREKTMTKTFNVTVIDSPRNRVNESNGSTVVKLPLNRDDVNEVEEQQGTGLV
uniref:Immunoglobulin domain-containing protein n=1 Tax=Cyprinus carpio carpio TaxID=630221 RepID=A0A9J7YQD9_CYPCA